MQCIKIESVSLSDFLSTCNFKSFIDQFVEEGITRIEDIEGLTSSKLAEFGFSETDFKIVQILQSVEIIGENSPSSS